MDAQEIRSLQEAYEAVYENQQLDGEQLQELSNRKLRAYIKKSEKSHKEINKKWDQGTATEKEKLKSIGHEIGQERAFKRLNKEEVDFFDVILEHLVAEGYADTNKAALAIMANMSEEWKQSIVEEMLDEGKKEFPFKKVSKKAAGHEMDFIKRGSPESGRRARKMKAIASTVEVGGDPRKTMHGQDLRKM